MSAERGLAVVQPQTIQPAPLVPYDSQQLRDLFRRVIAQGGSNEQVEAVILLCERYNLDPLLSHIILVKNKPYVTRDGLLHVAHMHPAFNGIKVTFERDGNFWVATCTVWRKDKDHPFVYSAHQEEHQRAGGGAWQNYPRAMTQKAAEAMCLKRAFDVALGTAEEIGYDGESRATSLGAVTVIEAEVVDGDQGAGHPQSGSGQLAAGVPATPARDGGDELSESTFGWTEFWSWARARGFGDRKSLDAAVGKPTGGLTPLEIRRLILAGEAGAKQELSPQEQAAKIIGWLGEKPRTEDQAMVWVAKLLALSEEQPVLESWRDQIAGSVHQDVLDLCWFDRMNALGRGAEPVTVVVEGEVVEGGQPGDDVPF